MRIAAVSDTHGELENLSKAFRRSVREFGIDVFIHLGDDYDDMNYIESGVVQVLRVPGIYSSHYSDPGIRNRVIREFEGWRFLLSHTPNVDGRDLPGDIDPAEVMASGKADVFLHGHTHIPEISTEKGHMRINPGHLRSNDKRGYVPTFCVMDLDGDSLDANIHLLDAEGTLFSRKFNMDDLRSRKE